MAGQWSRREVKRLGRKVFRAARNNQHFLLWDCLESLDPGLVKRILRRRFPHDEDQLIPLAVAAAEGHLQVVELLVNEHNVDLTRAFTYDYERHNALTCAASRGHLDVVKFLVINGCSMSAALHGNTPAYAACKGRHLDVLKCLVENGADVNDNSSNEGITCLMVACFEGYEEIVKYLLSVGANPNVQDMHNRTAVLCALMNNQSEVVALLYRHWVGLAREGQGRSPLIEAVLYRARATVKVILESEDVSPVEEIDALELLGAKLALENYAVAVRCTSEAMALRHQNPDVVPQKPHSLLPTLNDVQESQTLSTLRFRQSDLYLFRLECLAAGSRILGPADPETARLYLEYFEFFVDTGEHKGATETLLHYHLNMAGVRSHCYFHVFVYNFVDMIKQGMYGFFSDVEQVIELFFFAMENNEETAKFLTDKGADHFPEYILIGLAVARGQEEGNRLRKLTERFLHLECSSRVVLAVVDFILARAGDFYGLGEDDLPFHLLTPFLLQCGADVHFKDDRKNTALHALACLSEGKEDSCDLLSQTVQVLVQAGALVGVRNREGRTPLDLAGPALAVELRELYPVSLQSLAATAVVSNGIPYQTEVPIIVKDFLDKH